jgi:hypothetical protein
VTAVKLNRGRLWRSEVFGQEVLALVRRKIGQGRDHRVAAPSVEGQGRRVEGIHEGGPAAGLPGVGLRVLQQAATVALAAERGRHPQPFDVQPAPPQPAQQAAVDLPAVVAEPAGERVQVGVAHAGGLGGQKAVLDDPLILDRRVLLQDDVSIKNDSRVGERPRVTGLEGGSACFDKIVFSRCGARPTHSCEKVETRRAPEPPATLRKRR